MTIEELFNRMPICWDIFGKYTKSYPESWAEKTIWAYQKLKEEGESLFTGRILGRFQG